MAGGCNVAIHNAASAMQSIFACNSLGGYTPYRFLFRTDPPVSRSFPPQYGTGFRTGPARRLNCILESNSDAETDFRKRQSTYYRTIFIVHFRKRQTKQTSFPLLKQPGWLKKNLLMLRDASSVKQRSNSLTKICRPGWFLDSGYLRRASYKTCRKQG